MPDPQPRRPQTADALRFPREVAQLFAHADNADYRWERFTPDGQALLESLGVVLEPFMEPQPPVCTGATRGFELLAYGRDGQRYGTLAAAAAKAGLPSGALGVALFRVGLLTAKRLVERWYELRLGRHGADTIFTFNIDGDMLRCPLLDELLDHTPKPGYTVMLEVNERCLVGDVNRLRELADRHDWLGMALDDSNELLDDTRRLLDPRVRLVKADGAHVRRLYANRDAHADVRFGMVKELAKLRKPDRPFVAEGVESKAMKEFICKRWKEAHLGELWLQGWHVRVSDEWAQLLVPVRDGENPEGYLVPSANDSDGAVRITGSARIEASKANKEVSPAVPALSPVAKTPAALQHIDGQPQRNPADQKFVEHARKEMARILGDCPALKDEIDQRLAVADVTPVSDLVDLLEKLRELESLVNDFLRPATIACIEFLPQDGSDFLHRWETARAVLAWLAVLAVKDDWIDSFLQHHHGFGGIQFDIPVVTGMGVEIVSSRVRRRPASLPKETGRADLHGSGRFEIPTMPASYVMERELDELVLKIWVRLFPHDSRTKLSPHDLLTLNSELGVRSVNASDHYYLAYADGSATPFEQPGFLDALLEKLPRLTVIRMTQTEGGGPLWVGDEQWMQAIVRSFLEIPQFLKNNRMHRS